MLIGRRIREMREKKGMSVTELAEKSGLSVPGISQIENGKRVRPTEDSLRKIANALEVPYEVLTLTNREDDRVSVNRNLGPRRQEGNVTIKFDDIYCSIGITVLPPEKDNKRDDFDLNTFISTRLWFERALEQALQEVLFDHKDELMRKFYVHLDAARNSMAERMNFISRVMENVENKVYEVRMKNEKDDGEDF